MAEEPILPTQLGSQVWMETMRDDLVLLTLTTDGWDNFHEDDELRFTWAPFEMATVIWYPLSYFKDIL